MTTPRKISGEANEHIRHCSLSLSRLIRFSTGKRIESDWFLFDEWVMEEKLSFIRNLLLKSEKKDLSKWSIFLKVMRTMLKAASWSSSLFKWISLSFGNLCDFLFIFIEQWHSSIVRRTEKNEISRSKEEEEEKKTSVSSSTLRWTTCRGSFRWYVSSSKRSSFISFWSHSFVSDKSTHRHHQHECQSEEISSILYCAFAILFFSFLVLCWRDNFF